MIFWVSFKQIYSEPIALIFIPAKNDIGIMVFALIGLFNTNQDRPVRGSVFQSSDWTTLSLANKFWGITGKEISFLCAFYRDEGEFENLIHWINPLNASLLEWNWIFISNLFLIQLRSWNFSQTVQDSNAIRCCCSTSWAIEICCKFRCTS